MNVWKSSAGSCCLFELNGLGRHLWRELGLNGTPGQRSISIAFHISFRIVNKSNDGDNEEDDDEEVSDGGGDDARELTNQRQKSPLHAKHWSNELK